MTEIVASPVPAHDRRWLPDRFIILAIFYDVVNTIPDIQDARRGTMMVHLPLKYWPKWRSPACGKRLIRCLQKSSCTTRIATVPSACSACGAKANGALIDDGGWFLYGLKQVKNAEIGLGGVFQHIAFAGQ